jgi:WG containing repeat/Biotin-requiring enzyme
MLVKIGVPKGGAAIPGSALGSVRNLGHVGMFEKKQFDVICPGYGPNPGSATVVRWLKEEGDAVLKGDKIAEVRPKEAMAMLQAPGSGTLVRVEVKEGEEAKVGQAVAKMGIGRVPVELGGEWFYADERGTRVTQDRYQAVGSMLGGMAPVRVGEKWNFVDGEGRLIPKATDGKKAKGFSLGISEKAEYDEARKVRGGLAAVRLMDRWGYVAYQEGGIRMAIAPRFLQAKDFSEGLAAVEESEDAPVAEGTEVTEEKSEEVKKPAGPAVWGYILPSGKLWGRLDFAVAGDFLDGRAAVRALGENMPWVLIDSKMKTRTTKNYGGLIPLGAKRVAWKQSGGWGLMDLQERVMEIRPGIKNQDGEGVGQDVLEAVGPFGDERAPAKEPGGKWGYLDPEGKWAIPPKFERANVFHGGLAAAKESGGKWGYLKPDGSWGLEPKYTKARAFTDGLAAVSEQGEVELGVEGTMGGVWE